MTQINLPGPFWLVGCGNMAGAMLRRWLDCGMDPAAVTVIRPSGAPVAEGIRVVTSLPPGPPPALVMLGVKPQKLDDVAPGLAPHVGPQTTLISILAGVERAALRARFPAARMIARAMPNTPVALGKGATTLAADGGTDADRALVTDLMRPLGLVEWVEDEALLDVTGALTGSGPAFVFRFIDALARAAEAQGLPADQARRLAIANVEGAGALAAASEEDPHQLAERVASPGGMTRKGLDVLDAGDRLNQLVADTIDAAVRRSREMGREAGRG